jgi:hypothetical protein
LAPSSACPDLCVTPDASGAYGQLAPPGLLPAQVIFIRNIMCIVKMRPQNAAFLLHVFMHISRKASTAITITTCSANPTHPTFSVTCNDGSGFSCANSVSGCSLMQQDTLGFCQSCTCGKGLVPIYYSACGNHGDPGCACGVASSCASVSAGTAGVCSLPPPSPRQPPWPPPTPLPPPQIASPSGSVCPDLCVTPDASTVPRGLLPSKVVTMF